MEFKISTSGFFYPDAKDRVKLEKIGFTFNKSDYKGFTIVGNPTLEIKDLNELIKFSKKWGDIIVCDGFIEI